LRYHQTQQKRRFWEIFKLSRRRGNQSEKKRCQYLGEETVSNRSVKGEKRSLKEELIDENEDVVPN